MIIFSVVSTVTIKYDLSRIIKIESISSQKASEAKLSSATFILLYINFPPYIFRPLKQNYLALNINYESS